MEQLQQTLNEAIKMGYDYWVFGKSNIVYCTDGIVDKNDCTNCISYHDLFSKDSGLMEFMKWKDLHLTLYGVTGHYVNMCMMTAQEKINYFNTNAYLPGKK